MTCPRCRLENRAGAAFCRDCGARLGAVASEAFFERATQLRDESPELYAILQEFYRQDPAARV